MHSIREIENCFAEISKAENLEWVDSIPSVPKHYAKCWKLITEILRDNHVEEIELMIGFQDNFPYILPDIYFFDDKYDYIPHIDHKTRKLCYVEDGVTYDVTHIVDVLRDCIKKAKRLIENGVNKTNYQDFVSEINSYWFEQYDKEQIPLFNIVLYGSFPNESCLLDLYSYTEKMTLATSMARNVLINQEQDDDFSNYIKQKHDVSKNSALYLKSVVINHHPPYSLSFKQLVGNVQDDNDLRLLRSQLNKNRSLILFFKLLDSERFGGVIIQKQPSKRKGFRNRITAFDELFKFEKQNLPLQRTIGELYSAEIKKKRDGNMATNTQRFTIIGVGSIGSNLCYYLMGYSGSSFILVDNDVMRTENTGRHLLGFRFIGQAKSIAVQEYIKDKSPETSVLAYRENILNSFEERLPQINQSTALFLCAGDSMVEEFIIENVMAGRISVPIFIMWLEPFSIAGHLVYVNPEKKDKPICLNVGKLRLYKHNLIQPDMYEKRSDEFVKRDAGCNGSFALYNQNNVTLFLSSIFPIVDQLIENPGESKCYRWVGNINIANKMGLSLTDPSVKKGEITELSI